MRRILGDTTVAEPYSTGSCTAPSYSTSTVVLNLDGDSYRLCAVEVSLKKFKRPSSGEVDRARGSVWLSG